MAESTTRRSTGAGQRPAAARSTPRRARKAAAPPPMSPEAAAARAADDDPASTGRMVVDDNDPSADVGFGGELLSALDPMLLVSSLARTVSVDALTRALANLAASTPQILSGAEEIEIPASDWRFRDSAWHDNPLYKRWAQAYLAWEREMMGLIDANEEVDWRTRERGRLLMGALTTAASPTNSLQGNPEAIKAAFTTGGRSLFNGTANFIRDLVTNRGMPAQVDTTAFRVGIDIATTPGWVIHRTPMFELTHYTPRVREVGKVPLLLLPPPVNKYYFWDLAPGRSLIEYAVSRGVDVYTIVWRDPRPENGHWGINAYLSSALEALDAVCDVSGSEGVHVFGDCSGGMFLAMLLGYEQAVGRRSVRTGTFGVTVFDFAQPGGIGIAASDEGLASVRKRAEKGEVISAASISDTFVWMRPNDLVWRYLVDEWLLGKKPPVFDIMFWNADGQGLPSQLAVELTEMSLDNSLMTPGAMTVLDTPIDLTQVTVDTYQIAGLTDHISPWQACYAGARLLGGDNTFVLTPTGHVQSIIYPMGKSRAAHYVNRDLVDDAEAWRQAAERRPDSWWANWVDWILERSDGTRRAPQEHGNANYDLIVPAPGRYVLGE